MTGDLLGCRIIGNQLRTVIQRFILKIRFVYRIVEIIRQVAAWIRRRGIGEAIVRSLRFVHLDNVIFAVGCSNIFSDRQSNCFLTRSLETIRSILPNLDSDYFLLSEHLVIAFTIRNNYLVVFYIIICDSRKITTGLNLRVAILYVTNIRYLLIYESLKCRIGNSHCVRALTYAHNKLIRHFIIIIRLSFRRTDGIIANSRC